MNYALFQYICTFYYIKGKRKLKFDVDQATSQVWNKCTSYYIYIAIYLKKNSESLATAQNAALKKKVVQKGTQYKQSMWEIATSRGIAENHFSGT